MYILAYSEHVISNDIKKLSAPIKNLIQDTIEHKLLLDPFKFGKPLRYSFKNCRSLRVGDYRVIYQLQDTTINILVIRHRKDCYG